VCSHGGGRKLALGIRQFIFLLSVLVCASSLALPFPNKYDKFFKASVIFLPLGTPWQLLKSQCWQESRLKPRAVSSAGAMGLCQFMPATWSDLKRNSLDLKTPWNPESSIRACGVYMGKLYRGWPAKRSSRDRYKLALASYNAGLGNLVKAQELSGGKISYADIVEFLPKVTGFHSQETTTYVKNIFYLWLPQMLAN